MLNKDKQRMQYTKEKIQQSKMNLELKEKLLNIVEGLWLPICCLEQEELDELIERTEQSESVLPMREYLYEVIFPERKRPAYREYDEMELER